MGCFGLVFSDQTSDITTHIYFHHHRNDIYKKKSKDFQIKKIDIGISIFGSFSELKSAANIEVFKLRNLSKIFVLKCL